MKKLKLLLMIGILANLGCTTSAKAQKIKDWANLAQFQKANAALEAPSENEDRVVFMGNSITIGWLNSRPEFFKDKPWINRGISGQTTPQMLIRFRQDVIALKPKVVVILAGINDIAGNTGPATLAMIADNVKGMAELAHANDIKVIISSVLPAYDFPWSRGMKPAPKVKSLNAMMKAYCNEKGYSYLDYFSAMVDERGGLPKKYASDEVHPTKAGYAVMEPLVEAAIATALKK